MEEPSPQQPAARSAIGERLGDFVVVDVLGEGGSGTVYAARWGHRQVALKVLRTELLATDEQRRRFVSEAKILASIDHPGVVKVLQCGQLPDGRPYLAMERLEGETLAARLGRGALPVAEALVLFAQLADAVAALHARELVHRDLKPENVFVVPGGFAVLLDVGIAKGGELGPTQVTQEGTVRGTPAYMAPERFFGAPAGVATDIYELAVVLFAMLTARLPWSEPQDASARLNPMRPSELGAEVPSGLEAELMRALSTRPENRPASAAELAARVAAADLGAAAPRQTADLRGARPSGGSGPFAAAAGDPRLAPTPADSGRGAGSIAVATGDPAAPGAAAGATGARRRRLAVVAGVLAAGAAVGVGVWIGRAADRGGQPAPATPGASFTLPGRPSSPTETTAAPPPSPPITPAAPLEEPPPTGPAGSVPAEVWGYVPAETTALAGIRWGQLRQSPLYRDLRKEWADGQAAAAARLFALMCRVDLLDRLEWVALGVGGSNQENMLFAAAGDWTRDDLEACAKSATESVAPNLHLTRDGEVTRVEGGPQPMQLGWPAGGRTVLVALWPDVDSAWMRARVAGEQGAGTNQALASLRREVPPDATMWLVAANSPVLRGELLPGLPAPRALYASVVIADDLTIAIGLRYGAAAEAKKSAAAIDSKLTELRKDAIAGFLLGDTTVTPHGSDVRVKIHTDPKTSRLVGKAVVEAVAQQMSAK